MSKLLIFFSFFPLLLTGCDFKEDPELVKQLEETKIRVAAVEAELDAVGTEMKAIRTTDPSDELPELRVEIEKATAQKAALEEEIQKLGESQKKAAEDLAVYQEKYRLR